MSIRFILLASTLIAAKAWTSPSLHAQQAGESYPLVYGATGRPYGPTQAHYQYHLRYGRPWHGAGGVSGGVGVGGVNGYPSGIHGHAGTFGFFGPSVPVGPYAFPGMVISPIAPFFGYHGVSGAVGVPITPLPSNLDVDLENLPGNAPIQRPWREGFPGLGKPEPVVEPSTPQARQRSLRFQVQGDQQLQQLNFPAASERYRKAIDAARDRAEPRYRMGVTLAARSRFREAVEQFKLAVALDPEWAEDPEWLEDLLGERNHLEKVRIKHRVAEWTQEDVRDPDRLFLLAAFLYLDRDNRSRGLLETAVLLAGEEEHLVAFLAPQLNGVDRFRDAEPEAPEGAVPAPPPPQPPPGDGGGAAENGPLLPPLPE